MKSGDRVVFLALASAWFVRGRQEDMREAAFCQAAIGWSIMTWRQRQDGGN
jgi:hypothetical protein